MTSGDVQSRPVAPYWAVVLRENGRWEMVRQSEIASRLNPDPTREAPLPGDIHLAVGGFYPLIAEGRAVARAFPGGSIRAPRLAIGGTDGTPGTEGDDPRLVIVTSGIGAGGGLTTEELARVLLPYELDWALNLDGGRSAYLRVPGGQVHPRGVWFRRRGPVMLRVLPPASPLLRREMVE